MKIPVGRNWILERHFLFIAVMKVLQEILTVNHNVNLDDFLPGFDHKFGDKINVFKINQNNNFVIDFLEPYKDDEELKSKIKKFIHSEWVTYEVEFVFSQLPF